MGSKIIFIIIAMGGISYSLASPSPTPAGDPLQTFRNYYLDGKSTDAAKALEKAFNAEQDPAAKAKMAFGLGLINYQTSNPDKAAGFFEQALQLKTRLDDYAQYYLGMIERGHQDFKGAKEHFQAVRTHHPVSVREADAEIALAEIAKTQNKWGEAYNLLTHLEHRHRHDPQYQQILYNLVEASLMHKKPFYACRAAVKLYKRYPSFTLGYGWGMDLNKVKVSGNSLHCSVGINERDKRIQHLLLTGDFDEIIIELQTWQELVRAGAKPHPDESGKIEEEYGVLSMAEGKIKDAINHFLVAQDMMGRNFNTQMLLSKAYSQTDDYPSAVEGYLKAYNLSPRSKLGQKALFQAAFLSYENRDYDGASRHFEDVSKKCRGPIVWDARWHLAWIRYLKADYDGAIKEFVELSKNRHFGRPSDLEKLHYWRAMAELRNGNLNDARVIFQDLSTSKRLGYYTGAAMARLAALPPVPSPAPAPAPSVSAPSPAPSASPSAGAAKTSASSDSLSSGSRNPAATGNDEGLGSAKEEKDDSGPVSEDENENPEALSEGPSDLAPAPEITSLKNPALVARFEKAQDLIDLGFNSWAELELREIEKRTSNHGYLQSLMDEYLKAGDFYRSAYIADVIFEVQRENSGIEGATLLWGYAYPQAFFKNVISSSKKFDVSPSLVWSIMRGESGFREDIHSGAGALGLMQLIPPTAKKIAQVLGYKDFKNLMLLSPDVNILFGVKYLKRLAKVMSNSLPLVIASYNAGPHRVQGWLRDFGELDMDEFVEHIPYVETRNYVKKVLRNFLVYQLLYEKKTNPLKWLAQKLTVKYEGPKPTSESWDN